MNEPRPKPGVDPSLSTIESLPRVQRVSAVLWPSFLLAGLANVVFFALLDPFSLIDYSGEAPLTRTAAYSLGFFSFWLLTGAASMSTSYFLSTRVPPPHQFDEISGESAEDGTAGRRGSRSFDE